MFKAILLLLVTLIALAQAGIPKKRAVNGWDPVKNTYPTVQRGDVTFQYPSAKANGNVTVADAYNWLEKSTNDSDVKGFIQQQTTLTNSFLSQCKDKDSITQAVRQANDYIFYSHIIEVGKPEDPSYIFAGQGKDTIFKWYYATPSEMESAKKQNFAQTPGKLLIDESTLSQDNSLYIDNWEVSDDKKLAAYTVLGGDTGVELRFMDLTTFKPLPETIPYGGRMSFKFTQDNKAIVYDHQAYQKVDDPDPFNTQAQIFYHKIGSDPKSDIVIVQADTVNITNLWYAEFTLDYKFMMLYGLTDEEHFRAYVAPLDQQQISANMKWISLQSEYGAELQYVTNFGTDFYLVTKRDGAKNHKIVLGKIDPIEARTVKDLRELSGTIKTQDIIPENKAGIDMTQFKIEQHFATSKDGTKVPFDIFYSKNHPLDGTNPAWLLGYGSFGALTSPMYDAFMLPWVRDHGGVSVYLQIRGGGELGDSWHKAGMLEQRHHSFEDFQAVAEYLVKNKMAASGNIIAEGTEGGGTVAMVMGNQAPEGLFGVLLPSVAILDMLRFDKYPYPDQYIAEWGSPQDPKYFDVLRSYSPLHNIDNKKTYPATLLTQSLDDDQSTPAHSFKMIAELQHSLPKNANPLLLSVEEYSDKLYSETTNVLKQCFVNQVLGLSKNK
ncbi:hypothetical protein L7F22_003182 [Adiantum nelumboides]|nr:hypothetical protein [Adiantum nelumboides]